ncbi:psbP domain-containing chloroplastic [Micractinium conductrix]|uniref:PsbP domain-containing chloroplastic n=1 Tax=Micractinium conductrix TaxID=554055 RepID=A0A2P6VPA7_9CHLO|nr:psbP domain-containing chloroplastic [Micractinium conductrix]|eukprot:PSC75910.1 psbP domain-containing chloroplastic [Micractinium conductrix]
MTTACAVGASTSAALQGRARRSASRRGAALVCAAAPHSEQQQSAESSSRRTALLGAAGLALGAGLSGAAPQLAAAAPSQPVPVGDYLPAAPGMPGFCIYKPDSKKTVAIRAGVIKPDPDYYSFALPETWAEAQLLNILTGNFCMPKCEEPWYEAKFESAKEGSAQVIVTELQKLGSKPGASLAQLGTPESVVSRVGNFITGTNLEEEDVVSAEKKQFADGRDYYVYEVYAPYSKTGGHNLAAFTTKGGLAFLFVLTASDKQWNAAEPKLRKMLETFKA